MSNNHHSKGGKPKHKNDEDLRNEGIVLIQNAIKARNLSESLLDSIYDNRATVADINWACYMISQSIELSIKGLIKYYYESFREGHFVANNAKILESLSEKYSELREISNTLVELQGRYAVMLSRWSALGRYKALYVNKKEIEKADDLLDDIIKFLHRHHYECES